MKKISLTKSYISDLREYRNKLVMDGCDPQHLINVRDEIRVLNDLLSQGMITKSRLKKSEMDSIKGFKLRSVEWKPIVTICES